MTIDLCCLVIYIEHTPIGVNTGKYLCKYKTFIRIYCNWICSGIFRESLEYAHRQLSISEELDSPWMRAEAYINLATAHERMGALER